MTFWSSLGWLVESFRMPPSAPPLGSNRSGAAESRGTLALLGSSILFAPLNVLNLVAVNGVSVLRPYAPQLVPIAVCLFLVPFAICLSLYAGWSVWKSLAVGFDVPLYLQYGLSVTPYASAVLPPIQASQPYDISLHMKLPISESNMSLGNFMATLTLLTPSNETLVTVSRPCIVVSQATFWSFWSSSIANIDTVILNSFIAKTSNLLAHVEIGRQDGWKMLGDGQSREVSILSASLRAREIPRGIRGLAIRSPLLASTLAASLFFIILSLIVTSCVLPSMFPFPVDHAKDKDQVNERESKPPLAEPSSSGNTRPRSGSTALRARKSKLSRRRSSSSRNAALKVKEEEEEVPITVIPPSTGATTEVPEVSSHESRVAARDKLRRRTSRQLDESDQDLKSESEG